IMDGFAWGDLSDSGWTRVDDATATFTVELDDVECTPVVPENPDVTNAVCTGGALTDPTLETAETEGIDYSFDDEDVVNGGSVEVTATLQDGYEWGSMPTGWTKVDDATATYTVELDNVECTENTPVNPLVQSAVCTDGALTDPTITPAENDGMIYTMDGDVVNGGTVLLTATHEDGYSRGELLDGGTNIADGCAPLTTTLDTSSLAALVPLLPP